MRYYYYYAVLDENNVVIGISSLTGKTKDKYHIEIQLPDESLVGYIWDGKNFFPPKISSISFFAFLDSDNYVEDVRGLSITDAPPKNAVKIPALDKHLIGCKYVDGQFITLEMIWKRLGDIVDMLSRPQSVLPSSPILR